MREKRKKYITAFLSVILVFAFLPGGLGIKAVAPAEVNAETSLANPKIEANSSMAAGQKVTWDCVWFGSYPQTEIVDQASACGTYGKAWAQQSDYEVNAALYSELQNVTGWDSNGDLIASDGAKYRRIKSSDATYAGSSYSGEYAWDSSDTYHYFRYDKIKWRVLNVSGSQALLLADQGLDDQRYHATSGFEDDVTWATSTIRSWLNGYNAESNKCGTDYSSNNFIGSAFSSEEQGAILTTHMKNEDSISSGTEGGDDTDDMVFLLSESETYTDAAKGHGFVSDLNTADEARRCKTSTYAKAMGVWTFSDSSVRGNCDWWLRSPGNRSSHAAYIIDEGSAYVYYDAVYLNCDYYAVRPALTLDFTSSDLWSYAGTVCSAENNGSGNENAKKANTMKVTAAAKSIKASKLKKANQTVKPITISKAKGTVKVTKKKNGTTSSIYKRITVNKKTGAITFKKGKYAKKTYKVKLTIQASGNSNYEKKTITKTVKIKIK